MLPQCNNACRAAGSRAASVRGSPLDGAGPATVYSLSHTDRRVTPCVTDLIQEFP